MGVPRRYQPRRAVPEGPMFVYFRLRRPQLSKRMSFWRIFRHKLSAEMSGRFNTKAVPTHLLREFASGVSLPASTHRERPTHVVQGLKANPGLCMLMAATHATATQTQAAATHEDHASPRVLPSFRIKGTAVSICQNRCQKRCRQRTAGRVKRAICGCARRRTFQRAWRSSARAI